MKNSLRKKGWDYSRNAAYFITINMIRNGLKFSEINQDQIQLSELGKLVEQKWFTIPKVHFHIEIGAYVIMPDHFHGIIYFSQPEVKTRSTIATYEPQRKNLSSAIRGFKAAVTIDSKLGFPTFKWQRGFHDQILWNQKSIETHHEYIYNNPMMAWEKKTYKRKGAFGVY